MGQKVHPKANRLGIVRSWDGKWFAKEGFKTMLLEDIVMRKIIKREYASAGVSRIEIDKTPNHIHIKIIAGRPGLIIGRSGSGIDQLLKKLHKALQKLRGQEEVRQMNISVEEVPSVDLEAQLVAENIASQLEKRISFRRAMKQALGRTMRAGALGVRTETSGRLVGADMARTEWYLQGKVPLHTFSADVDFGFTEAHTKYGQIGVKVWIHRPPSKEES